MLTMNKGTIAFPCFSKLLPWLEPVQKASFAFITSEQAGERCYLLQWNAKWQCYNFIGGKVDADKGDEDDFGRAIRREIAEEIGIGSLDHIIVEHEIRRIQMCQYSQREKRTKHYLFALFEIRLFPDLPIDPVVVTHALKWLSSRQENAYVTRAEVETLQTRDGKPISDTVRCILQELGELEPLP